MRAGLDYHTAEERLAYERGLTEDSKGRYQTYVDAGHYAQQLERYLALFGPDRVPIRLFEDLVAAPGRRRRGCWHSSAQTRHPRRILTTLT
ncbi:hypothetical protein ACFV5N_00060 [Streptomyces sp. NPDC059853]|uniref:hypothetical protein n=1 Tax=Streptomyces sp. NPDC059853 TaxID=3346973 RepID=UPI00364B35B1